MVLPWLMVWGGICRCKAKVSSSLNHGLLQYYFTPFSKHQQKRFGFHQMSRNQSSLIAKRNHADSKDVTKFPFRIFLKKRQNSTKGKPFLCHFFHYNTVSVCTSCILIVYIPSSVTKINFYDTTGHLMAHTLIRYGALRPWISFHKNTTEAITLSLLLKVQLARLA